LIRWSEASAFGNFLDGFSETERAVVRLAYTDLLETKRVPDGLRLERYLRFAFARNRTLRQTSRRLPTDLSLTSAAAA
jgi:hypothetical protein